MACNSISRCPSSYAGWTLDSSKTPGVVSGTKYCSTSVCASTQPGKYAEKVEKYTRCYYYSGSSTTYFDFYCQDDLTMYCCSSPTR